MSDSVMQELIVRMASDGAFADQVRADPGLLDSYDLTTEERARLIALEGDLAAGAYGLGSRESKSSMFMMGAFHDLGHHATAGTDPDVTPIHHGTDGAPADASPPVHEATPLHDPTPVPPPAPPPSILAGPMGALAGVVDALAPIADKIPGVGVLANAAHAAVNVAAGVVGAPTDTGDSHVHAASAGPAGMQVGPPPVPVHIDLTHAAPGHAVVPGASHVPPPPGISHGTPVPPGASNVPPPPGPLGAGPLGSGFNSNPLGGGFVGGLPPADPGHPGAMPLPAGPLNMPAGSLGSGFNNPFGGGFAGGGLVPGDTSHVHAAFPVGPDPGHAAPPINTVHPIVAGPPSHVPPPGGIAHPTDLPPTAPASENLAGHTGAGAPPSGTIGTDTPPIHPAPATVHPPTPVHLNPDDKPNPGGLRQYLGRDNSAP